MLLQCKPTHAYPILRSGSCRRVTCCALPAQILVLMVPYTTISDTDGAFALAFADVGMGWARYLVSAGAESCGNREVHSCVAHVSCAGLQADQQNSAKSSYRWLTHVPGCLSIRA